MTHQVFISVKMLDDNGVATRDATIAREVYEFLSQHGLSVFFSAVSLEALGSSSYKETIDAALDSALVLVTVGTSAANINGTWVRYEWNGFVNDILSGIKPDGRVFNYIDGFGAKELPRALRQYQTFARSADSLQRLLNFINRILPSSAGTLAQAASSTKSIGTVFVSFDRQDLEAAQRIIAALETAGLSVYAGSGSGVAGDTFDPRISEEIKRCTFFLPLISVHTAEQYEGRYWREWNEASERARHMTPHRPFILPVIVGDAATPVQIPQTFRQLQWTQAERELPKDFVDRLVRDARRLERDPTSAN